MKTFKRLILNAPMAATVALVTLVVPSRGDVVFDWNSAALDAIQASNTSGPQAARNLAIL